MDFKDVSDRLKSVTLPLSHLQSLVAQEEIRRSHEREVKIREISLFADVPYERVCDRIVELCADGSDLESVILQLHEYAREIGALL